MRNISWHVPLVLVQYSKEDQQKKGQIADPTVTLLAGLGSSPYVKFKYIFQFLATTLPIHYATFIGIRWRIRRVLSVTKATESKSSEKFPTPKICEILTF